MSHVGEQAQPDGFRADFHPVAMQWTCLHCGGEAGCAAAERFDWGFLDGIYCISLRHREDRAQDTARELHRIGLCKRAVFYRPSKDRVAKRGCWESHRAVAADARARGLQRVLIVEDDVAFPAATTPATARRVGAALASLPSDWMGFYLGHWALWAYPVRRNVLRCSSLCTHAYVASERLLDWLCESPFDRRAEIARRRIGGKGIDTAFAVLPAMYAYAPLLATQRHVSNDHLKASRIRLWPPRKLFLDLFVRSRIRDHARAHAMGANEKLVTALTSLALPGVWAARRLSRPRADRKRAAILAPGVSDPS